MAGRIQVSEVSKRTYNGIKFDSQLEMRRYIYLENAQNKGLIKELTLQTKFVLLEKYTDANGKKHRATNYFADFDYIRTIDGKRVVEDTKGMLTELFKLKYKFLCKNPEFATSFRIVKDPNEPISE